MSDTPTAKQMTCPNCQAQLPIHGEYVTWCDVCEWNLMPTAPATPNNIFQAVYAGLGRRQSQSLFEEVRRAGILQPTMTWGKAAAFALAGLIHGVTLLFLLLGLALPMVGWPNVLALIGGLLCLGIAWLLRPRFGKLPADLVTRQSFPHLFQLVEQVAAVLHLPGPIDIAIQPIFNAAFGRIGRRQVLYLGLPLWSILSWPERLALLGHELAHGVNGDGNRHHFIMTALQSLGGWYYLIHPRSIWPDDGGLVGLFMVPVNLIAYGVAELIRLLAGLLVHLLWHDSQRAEYLADHLGATIGGTGAMLSVLEKLYLAQSFYVTLQRTALNPSQNLRLFEELKRRVEQVPPRELERIRRVQQRIDSRLDVTHPPTPYRVNLLQMRPPVPPGIELTAAELALIEAELAQIEERMEKKLINAYQDSLYY